MSQSGDKVVQTDLPGEEYRRLKRIVDERDITIKQAVREAVRDWADENMQYDPDDPIFNVEPHDGDEEIDVADTDRLLGEVLGEDLDEPDDGAPNE